MKKLALAATILALITSACFASEQPKPMRVTIELQKNGKLLCMVDMGSDCVRSNRGDVMSERIAGTTGLTTGVLATVTPIKVTPDDAAINVRINYSQLEPVAPVPMKVRTVTAPETNGFSSLVEVQLKPGQDVELPTFGGADKYSLIIHGLPSIPAL
jgi:hypothetical protein